MSAPERWVGVEDVAAHLGVNKDSVYRWIEKKGLPAHRVGRLFVSSFQKSMTGFAQEVRLMRTSPLRWIWDLMSKPTKKTGVAVRKGSGIGRGLAALIRDTKHVRWVKIALANHGQAVSVG